MGTAYESSPFKDLGFKDPNGTQRNYKGNVRWTGFNGLIEYVGNENIKTEYNYTLSQPDWKDLQIRELKKGYESHSLR